MAVEHVRTWKVGAVEVSRIVEVDGFADNISMLFQGGEPQLLLQYPWLQPHFATADGKMILSFQAFVIRAGDRRIMVDTCIGNDRQRQFPIFNDLQTSFLDDIAAVGCPAESIDTVLCTHLHFDHTGWNTRLVDGKWVPTFPNARYLIARSEYEDLKHAMATGEHYTGHVPDSVQPILDAGLVDFIDIEHRVTDEIRLFPTPGHTAGHCSVHISSQGQEAVITGDLMHHPVQCAEPDREGNFDGDAKMACRTRRAFLERYCDGRSLIIGSHFADPTAGRLVKDGAAWRLAVEAEEPVA
jgi:glyoxylase-like metal-dependent hydrolase (beta-lactamase superfamily II)